MPFGDRVLYFILCNDVLCPLLSIFNRFLFWTPTPLSMLISIVFWMECFLACAFITKANNSLLKQIIPFFKELIPLFLMGCLLIISLWSISYGTCKPHLRTEGDIASLPTETLVSPGHQD